MFTTFYLWQLEIESEKVKSYIYILAILFSNVIWD